MTVAGTLNKSLFLVVLTIIAGLASAAVTASSPGLGQGIGIIAVLAGLGLGFFTIFKPQVAPMTSPAYAVCEGLFLGFVSLLFEAMYPGIVAQAVLGTLFVALAMMVAYRSQVIRVTPMFTRVVILATIGIFLTYAVGFIVMLFGGTIGFLVHPTLLGIGFSVFCIVIAAMNLILDFDYIAQGAANGVDKSLEWYGAFSLLVTLVWLYLEILRLLSYLNSK